MFLRFKNRDDAASQLLPLLNKYRDEDGIILAIPRGGVPLGFQLAQSLNLPLELLMTKKIGHPTYQEFAIGAVSLEDEIVNEEFSVPLHYIKDEIQRIRQSLKDNYKKYMGSHKSADLKNKIIIITDDGIATENIILSSIQMLRKKGPKKIVVAVPVVSYPAAEKIETAVDEFICLHKPDPFVGVGLYYEDFAPVTDEEVTQLLKESGSFEKALR